MTELTPRQQLIVKLHGDRVLAHKLLFPHRHPHASPFFHEEMIVDFHSPVRHVLDMVFRGGAKTTISEEGVVIKAGLREFKNCLVLGSNKDRAAERVHNIRMEIETNELFRKIFGDLVGPVWGDGELVLANGRRILALGRGQSIRGIKFEDMRPDFIDADDLEERAEAWTEVGRDKVYQWFIRDLLPACDPGYRARVKATPLHPKSLPMRLSKSKYTKTNQRGWLTHTYPIYYLNEQGEKVSSWPDRFPMEAILDIEKGFRETGDIEGFMAEYMCQAEAPESKPFKKEMIRVEPRVKTFQAIQAMIDPARTVTPQAATTGAAVWSWVGPTLVIWDAWGRRLMPDQVISSMFDINEHHSPIHIGFEEDGLNQWALQPIRQEQVKRGIVLPIKAIKAPKGKLDFIRGLQPFFHSRQVEFAKPLPDLEEQLLGFPTGDIDVPNALAYALRLRPGAPIYDGFRGSHVAPDIVPLQGRPLWLCLNATRTCLTAVAAQVFDGALRIYWDAVREGDPTQLLAGLVAEAQLEFPGGFRLVAGPQHFQQYNNVGLIQAAARLPREVRNGVDCGRGRSWIDDAIGRDKHGLPALMVSDAAHWTLNAFFGGYCRVLEKQGVLADYAEEGLYRVLMEGLETFAGLLDLSLDGEDSRVSFNAETAQGKAYHSMLPGQSAPRASKGDWNRLLKG